ncbi:MAG: DUF1570 domain-containing protein, partial [Planctomycetota bacterium]
MLIVWLVAALVVVGGGRRTVAQSDTKEADSQLILPAQGVGRLDLAKLAGAKPTPPTAKACYVRGDGGALVAKVLAELGDERLVKLPTGELEVVAKTDTRPTKKPFRSASRQQVIDHLKAGKFGDFTFVESGYYIFAHQGSEAFLLHTRSILESLLPGVVAQLREWGLDPQRPETPMVVIIMPSRAAFDALEKMPEGVAAYYNGLSNYVVLYEDERLWRAAPEYAFKQAAYTVAHEGIHQILANTGIQQRLSDWPQWMSEGLPEFFCPLRVSSRLIKRKGEELPERTLRWQRPGMVNDLRMHHLLRTTGRSGELIEAAVQSQDLTAYGYAVSWGLVHYLQAKKQKAFSAYLKEVSQAAPLMPPVGTGGDRNYRGPDPLFVKHFGENYPAIEAGVQRHLTKGDLQRQYRDPIENQTHYVLKR